MNAANMYCRFFLIRVSTNVVRLEVFACSLGCLELISDFFCGICGNIGKCQQVYLCPIKNSLNVGTKNLELKKWYCLNKYVLTNLNSMSTRFCTAG